MQNLIHVLLSDECEIDMVVLVKIIKIFSDKERKRMINFLFLYLAIRLSACNLYEEGLV